MRKSGLPSGPARSPCARPGLLLIFPLYHSRIALVNVWEMCRNTAGEYSAHRHMSSWHTAAPSGCVPCQGVGVDIRRDTISTKVDIPTPNIYLNEARRDAVPGLQVEG